MKYSQDKIRNVMLAGHAGAGKTTLAEALLFYTKTTDRFGRVEDGNTVMDFEAEEVKRKASLSTATASLEFDDVRINLVDTPGLFDFELGLYEGIMAAESVLVAVSARDGLQVGAVKAYKMALKYGKSRMIYVSKVDAENADFYKVLEEIKHEFGPSCFPIVVPVQVENDTIYVHVVREKAYKYENGVAKEVPMPDTGHRLDGLKTAISEAVAETDEALFEKYFSGEDFTLDEIVAGVKSGVKSGSITPVICGSTTKLEATDLALDSIRYLLPSPAMAGTVMSKDRTGNEVELNCDEAGPVVAYIFKTVADPFVGKLSYIKVISGLLKSDTPLVNGRTGDSERIGKLVFIKGKKQIDTGEIAAGDIGAVTKLTGAKTGDTLCAVGKVFNIERPSFPTPTLAMSIKLKQKGDESKISGALQRLIEEDLTLHYHIDSETIEQILSGLGEQHLDVTLAKLKTKFGVEAALAKPRVAFRESIRKKVKAEGKHKKQTGGHGQFGHVWIEFEPCDAEGLLFEEKVFGGSVPRNYFPAVEKGLQSSILHGVLAGYPVVGLKATLLDGSYHPVDSSEMAFKLAASLAYRAGLPQASPVLLEPIGALKAFVPDSNTGDVMGEVNKRRGRVLGMNPAEDGLQLVEAEVPVNEMHDFTTFMRSLTGGRGHFNFAFTRYEPLPQIMEGKVIEEAKKIIVQKDDEE